MLAFSSPFINVHSFSSVLSSPSSSWLLAIPQCHLPLYNPAATTQSCFVGYPPLSYSTSHLAFSNYRVVSFLVFSTTDLVRPCLTFTVFFHNQLFLHLLLLFVLAQCSLSFLSQIFFCPTPLWLFSRSYVFFLSSSTSIPLVLLSTTWLTFFLPFADLGKSPFINQHIMSVILSAWPPPDSFHILFTFLRQYVPSFWAFCNPYSSWSPFSLAVTTYDHLASLCGPSIPPLYIFYPPLWVFS